MVDTLVAGGGRGGVVKSGLDALLSHNTTVYMKNDVVDGDQDDKRRFKEYIKVILHVMEYGWAVLSSSSRHKAVIFFYLTPAVLTLITLQALAERRSRFFICAHLSSSPISLSLSPLPPCLL